MSTKKQAQFRVGDRVVYQITSITSRYYGIVLAVDTRKQTCKVRYTDRHSSTGKPEVWVDESEPFSRLTKLTKLEQVLS